MKVETLEMDDLIVRPEIRVKTDIPDIMSDLDFLDGAAVDEAVKVVLPDKDISKQTQLALIGLMEWLLLDYKLVLWGGKWLCIMDLLNKILRENSPTEQFIC